MHVGRTREGSGHTATMNVGRDHSSRWRIGALRRGVRTLGVVVAIVVCAFATPSVADTVLVGVSPNGATSASTGLVKSYTVTSSGTVWTANAAFNTDAIGANAVTGLGQDIYGNVYASGSNGIYIYRQTGGANIGTLTAAMGSGNLTGNGFEGLTIGADGKMVGSIPFGSGSNRIIQFDTTTLASGSIQTAQSGTALSVSGLNVPRGMTVASDGNLYIANRAANNVLRWNGSTTGTAFSLALVQGITWDGANNRFLTAVLNTSGTAGGVGTATLAGSTSPTAIASGSNNYLAVIPIEGTVAAAYRITNSTTGAILSGGTTVVSSGIDGVVPMLNVRDTRIWSGGDGSWSAGASWTQGLGGATGTATFTSGTGADPLPSILTFTGSAGGTATNNVSGSVFVGGLNFAPGAGSYTLSGSAFTLAADANIRNLATSGTQIISANVAVVGSQWIYSEAGSTLDISGGVSGAGTVLTKVGSGLLRLSGSNSYSGGTTISSGTVLLGNANGLGATSGALAVNGGALNLGGYSPTVGALSGASGATITTTNATGTATLTTSIASGNSTYAGTIANNGSGVVALTKLGSGTLTLSGSSANTFTGTTTVSAGALNMIKTSGNAVGGDVLVNNAQLLWGTSAIAEQIPDSASLTITGASSLVNYLTSIANTTMTETLRNVTMDGGIFWVGGASGTWTFTGTGSFTGGSGSTLFGVSSGGRVSFGTLRLTNMTGGTVSAPSSFGLNGGGTTSVTVGAGGLTLDNSNVVLRTSSVGSRLVLNGPLTTIGSSSSAVVVDANGATTGTTAIELSGTTGNVTRTFTIGGGGADFTSFVPITNGSATTAGITKEGAGTFTMSGSNSYTGATTINAGTLFLDNGNALAGTGTVTFGGGVLRYGTNNAVDYAAKIMGSGSAIAIDTNGRAVTFGSALASTNTGGLTKSGSGSLALNAANLYSGATTISAGTLALGASGSFDSSPTITVGSAGSSGAVLDLTAKSSGFTFGSGQTVKGIGTIQMAAGKTLTINGTLAAGNSPGTLTVAGGDLVLGGSSITSYEINGTNNTVGSGTNDLTTVSGSLALGGTLNVIASPAFDLFGNRTWRVFNYATSGTGSLTGSMVIGTTPDTNYLYSLNTATAGQVNLFVQRKADQSTTFTMTTGTVSRALVNSTVGLSGTITNTSISGAASLGLGLGSTGQLSVTGLTTGSVAPTSSTAVVGTINTGSTTGSRTWTVVNTDTSAITQSSTATGSLTVVNQRQFSLSSGTLALGNFLRTGSVSGSTTISSSGTYGSTANATLGSFSGTNTNGFGLGLTSGSANFAGAEATQQAVYSLSGSASSAGVINGSFSSSVTAELGSIDPLNVVLTGTAYDPATAQLAYGGVVSGTNWSINLGEFNQGAGTSTPWSFGISNLLQSGSFTADLALSSFVTTQNSGAIFLDLTGTSFTPALQAGGTNSFTAWMSLTTPGSFTNIYNLSFNSSKGGSSLGGTPQNVTLTVTGIIVVPEPEAIALAGLGMAIAGWTAWRRRRAA